MIIVNLINSHYGYVLHAALDHVRSWRGRNWGRRKSRLLFKRCKDRYIASYQLLFLYDTNLRELRIAE